MLSKERRLCFIEGIIPFTNDNQYIISANQKELYHLQAIGMTFLLTGRNYTIYEHE